MAKKAKRKWRTKSVANDKRKTLPRETRQEVRNKLTEALKERIWCER